MRDPWTGVDFVFLDQPDDAREIGWQRIAAGEQGHLASMHQRMAEADFLRGDAHVDESPGEADVIQRVSHRLVVARRIDDDLRERAVRESAELLKFAAVAFAENGVWDAHLFAAERESLLVEVEHDGFRAAQFDEFDHRQPDWTCADDEHRIA